MQHHIVMHRIAVGRSHAIPLDSTPSRLWLQQHNAGVCGLRTQRLAGCVARLRLLSKTQLSPSPAGGTQFALVRVRVRVRQSLSLASPCGRAPRQDQTTTPPMSPPHAAPDLLRAHPHHTSPHRTTHWLWCVCVASPATSHPPGEEYPQEPHPPCRVALPAESLRHGPTAAGRVSLP
jgi:hypothetical protein